VCVCVCVCVVKLLLKKMTFDLDDISRVVTVVSGLDYGFLVNG